MIGKKRFNTLIAHLLDLEKQTGMPLRKEPKNSSCLFDCPIENFAPEKDKDGNQFSEVHHSGIVQYGEKHYKIYSAEESTWWLHLSIPSNVKYTIEIIKWVKAREKQAEATKLTGSSPNEL